MYQINITDVDDKIILRARRNKLLDDFAAENLGAKLASYGDFKARIDAAMAKKQASVRTRLPSRALVRLRRSASAALRSGAGAALPCASCPARLREFGRKRAHVCPRLPAGESRHCPSAKRAACAVLTHTPWCPAAAPAYA